MNNKTGYRGVSLDKRSGKFCSRVVYNSKNANLGCYKHKIQAAIVKYYHIKLNNIILTDDLDEGRKNIIEWGLERNLTNFDINVEKKMFEEELQELKDAESNNDIYEIIDAYNDMYVVMTQTLGKAGLIKFDITKDETLNYYFKLYLAIPDKIRELGYDFDKTLSEVGKEINSRLPDPLQRSVKGKWNKWKDQPTSTLYKANYSSAKVN